MKANGDTLSPDNINMRALTVEHCIVLELEQIQLVSEAVCVRREGL